MTLGKKVNLSEPLSPVQMRMVVCLQRGGRSGHRRHLVSGDDDDDDEGACDK